MVETVLDVVTIETPSLGDRSYLATDGRVGLVVDPQRDLDRVLAEAERRSVRVTHVLETHVHNDYVTGGLALARRTGATYLVSADDDVAYERTPIAHGDVVEIGPTMRVRALATPGHTFHHLSYALEGDGGVKGVFTGGSLLFGTTGRPDLLGPDNTGTLVRAQHDSVRKLADELPGETPIYPTHGFGSFCSSSPARVDASTIGREKLANPALTLDEEAFVSSLLAGLDVYPAYYARMAAINVSGPGEPDLSPPAPADPGELRRRIAAGEWVVDLRSRTAFASGHVPGTLNFGLDGNFVTYLGWLIPWDTPVTLLGETPQRVAEAQRELVRIGIDRPAAAAAGGPEDWSDGRPLRAYPTATFADLASEPTRPVVLDVRRDLERQEARVADSLHIPLHDLPRRLDEVPRGPVWVHCASGYRASIAGSLLDAAERDVVVMDDDFDNAEKAGLTDP
ncbi:MAG: MBL fold metallo-hydrolase [Streptosporangiaceae bacterium]